MFGIDSDTLSAIAIVISILGTVASLVYTNQSIALTRKQFEADFHPHFNLHVQEQGCGKSGLKTCLSFKLRNQSPDRTATNVRLEACLSHPIWRWGLWTIRWYPFFEQKIKEIPPDMMKSTGSLSQGHYAEGLENFLLQSFPQFVYPENNPSTPEEVAFKKPVKFLMRVRVRYQAPIMHAANLKQDFFYDLTPQFHRNNGHPYCLNFWETKEIKRK